MRYRTTILFLLAFALGSYPALQANRSTAVCADRLATPDSAGESGNALTAGLPSMTACNDLYGQTQMERTMEVLGGICALGGCVSAAKAWRERQQDRALLRGDSASAWGRGVRYR